MARARWPSRRILALVGLALALLAAVLAARALRLRPQPVATPPAAALTVDRDGVAARLARLIRVPTVSHDDPAARDPAVFASLHAALAESWPRAHAALRREAIGAGSLLYTWPGRDATMPPLLLLAHLDVVPVEPGSEGAWTHPPFAGDVAEGFVWGRGAWDDKAGVAGILEAVESLLAQGFAPRRTVLLAFGHDEEVGGAEGAARIAALLAERRVEPALVLDEGGLVGIGLLTGVERPVALVGIAEKGYLSLELTVEAAGGHSSMPPAETAIGVLSRAVARLEARPLPARLAGPTRRLLETLAPEMPFGRRLLFANLWLTAPLVERALAAGPGTNAQLRTTTAPTIFQAGVKENQLPSRARAVVNFRLAPGDEAAEVVAHARAAIADPRVALRPLRSGEASPTSDPDSAEYALVADAIRQAFPEAAVAPYLVVGGTDARWYASLSPHVFRFLPVRARGSADLARFHGRDERVALDDLERGVRFYAALVRAAAGAATEPG